MPVKGERGSKRSRKSSRAIRTRSGKLLLPKPVKGALGRYSTKKPAAERRKDLLEDVKKIGYTSTMRDLNVRAIMFKNTEPQVEKKMRNDMEYLRKLFGKSKRSTKSSTTRSRSARSKSSRS